MALPLPRKYYTSHCAATRRKYPDCSGRGFGACGRCRVSDPWFFRPVLVPCELHRHIGDPTPSRTENRGVADHCLTNLAMGSGGTRGRIQTYDLPLRRRLLLFAELLGRMSGYTSPDQMSCFLIKERMKSLHASSMAVLLCESYFL